MKSAKKVRVPRNKKITPKRKKMRSKPRKQSKKRKHRGGANTDIQIDRIINELKLIDITNDLIKTIITTKNLYEDVTTKNLQSLKHHLNNGTPKLMDIRNYLSSIITTTPSKPDIFYIHNILNEILPSNIGQNCQDTQCQTGLRCKKQMYSLTLDKNFFGKCELSS
jgi:hypothetical protein